MNMSLVNVYGIDVHIVVVADNDDDNNSDSDGNI